MFASLPRANVHLSKPKRTSQLAMREFRREVSSWLSVDEGIMRFCARRQIAVLCTFSVVALVILNGGARSEVPFTFTMPQSGILVQVSDPSLLPDAAAAKPNYFKLTRREPLLIVSGWLEPGQNYKGLNAFWQSELRSPAFAGDHAPIRVETLREGAWELVAFDVSLPNGVQSNLRAERVEANTWIDLHMSTVASAKTPPTKLRAELLAALRQIQVLHK